MACDYDQTRYILKQGNVTSINLKDVNSEYNLLGFYNNKSVFEYTDEKLNSEPEQTNEINLKKEIDSPIVSKQIIVKSISSSGRIVLINDKKIVPVKRCTYFPIRNLKKITDKKFTAAGNLANVNNTDSGYLTLTKGTRTYEKKKDKTYQSANTDNRIFKINKDLKACNMIKEIGDKCTTISDSVKLEVRKINKPCEDKLVSKITQSSIDSINHKLKVTSPNNVIYIKKPAEHYKTINDVDKQNLNVNTKEKASVSTKSICMKTYGKKKSVLEDSDVNVLNSNSQIPAYIDLTSDTKSNDTENDCEDLQFVKVISSENDVYEEEIQWKPKDNLNFGCADMGKIKHFKEKSSTEINSVTDARKCVESVSNYKNGSSTNEHNETKAPKITPEEIIFAEPQMALDPDYAINRKKRVVNIAEILKKRNEWAERAADGNYIKTIDNSCISWQIGDVPKPIKFYGDEVVVSPPKSINVVQKAEAVKKTQAISKICEVSNLNIVITENEDGFYRCHSNPNIIGREKNTEHQQNIIKRKDIIKITKNKEKCNTEQEINHENRNDHEIIDVEKNISTINCDRIENTTVTDSNDKAVCLKSEKICPKTPVTNTVLNLNVNDDSLSQRMKNKRRQRAKRVNKELTLRREIEKIIKGTMGLKKKQKTKSVEEKTLKHSSCQTVIELSDSSTQTEKQELNCLPVVTDPVDISTIDLILDEPVDCKDDKSNIIGNNVNFGVGPQMQPYNSGEIVTYMMGNNLNGMMNDSMQVLPSQVVDTTMGYVNVSNVNSGGVSGVNYVLTQKQIFFEYLRNCCQQDAAGNMPLHLAVISNNLAEVRKQALMLNLRKLSIDCPNSNDLTPLHLAVINNSHEDNDDVVRFLLRSGADLRCKDSDGNSPMHLAVYYNSLNSLKVLVQKANEVRFNLNDFNYEGFTPLLLATIEDKYEMVDILLQYGADANITDQKSGRTPLFHAVENNNLKMVQLLLENGANKKIKNFSGTSTHDAIFELEGISPEIKNRIIGRDLFTVNSTRTDKRKKNTEKAKDEICSKKLKTVKTYRKIKI